MADADVNEFRPMVVVRAGAAQATEATLLLNEYYSYVGVLHRDTPTDVVTFLTAADAGFWIAYVGATAAGCVALRPLPALAAAGECKRLYVRPAFRRRRIADSLLDALEAQARRMSLAYVYLDSKDDLEAAILLYRRRDYQSCERYNDNEQATIFLRKQLTQGPPCISSP